MDFCSLFSDNKNRCPICYRHLKSWPARLGAEFVCMSPHRCTGPNADGSGKRAMRNLEGRDDRLTCFNCDFDMCRHGIVHTVHFKIVTRVSS